MKTNIRRCLSCLLAVWVAHVAWAYFSLEHSYFARFSPMGSLIVAIEVTVVVLLLGQVFRIKRLRHRWESAGRWPLLLLLFGATALTGDYLIGRYCNVWISWLRESGFVLIGFPCSYFPTKNAPGSLVRN